MFVGTTALGTREVVATPIDTLFAGVEVQATVADNLLQHDFIRRPEHGVDVETQIVLGLGSSRRCSSGGSGCAWGAVASPPASRRSGAAPVAADVDARHLPLAALPTLGLISALGDDGRRAASRSSAAAPIRPAGQRRSRSA